MGFTLAEVLITLAIVGVVAAMTIPTMVANYQKTQYVTQLKAVYSQLSQAMQQLKADEGVSKISDSDMLTYDDGSDWDEAKDRAGGFLKKYFKVIKDCGRDSTNICFAKDYSIDGTEGPYNLNAGDVYNVITSNGTSIGILPASIGTG